MCIVGTRNWNSVLHPLYVALKPWLAHFAPLSLSYFILLQLAFITTLIVFFDLCFKGSINIILKSMRIASRNRYIVILFYVFRAMQKIDMVRRRPRPCKRRTASRLIPVNTLPIFCYPQQYLVNTFHQKCLHKIISQSLGQITLQKAD